VLAVAKAEESVPDDRDDIHEGDVFVFGPETHGLPEALGRAVDLILELAGGQVAGGVHRVGADLPWQREILLRPDFVHQKLGFEIPEAEMRAALNTLELPIVREEQTPLLEGSRTTWTISIPSWRDDLDRPIDLVEEILRVYGTEKIPASVVMSPGLIASDDPIVAFNRRVSDYLVGQRFNECVNYTLRSTKEMLTWISQTAASELAIANPLVEDQSHLRATLITGLLDSLRLNRSRGVSASRLFETGRVFVERNGQNFECVAVGFIIAEDPTDRNWLARASDDFFSVKRHVETLAGIAAEIQAHGQSKARRRSTCVRGTAGPGPAPAPARQAPRGRRSASASARSKGRNRRCNPSVRRRCKS